MRIIRSMECTAAHVASEAAQSLSLDHVSCPGSPGATGSRIDIFVNDDPAFEISRPDSLRWRKMYNPFYVARNHKMAGEERPGEPYPHEDWEGLFRHAGVPWYL